MLILSTPIVPKNHWYIRYDANNYEIEIDKSNKRACKYFDKYYYSTITVHNQSIISEVVVDGNVYEVTYKSHSKDLEEIGKLTLILKNNNCTLTKALVIDALEENVGLVEKIERKNT